MFAGETGIEQQVREALDSLSIAYIQEHPIQHNEKLKRGANFYFIDFFLPDSNIALEADGLYWHRSRQDADTRRDLFLANQGITVIRITDKEIESADSISELLIQRITKLR
jgi:very-short-patch-repair endonuclease